MTVSNIRISSQSCPQPSRTQTISRQLEREHCSQSTDHFITTFFRDGAVRCWGCWEREREREGRSLSVVSSQCASQYAQCWAGWLCCAVCLSSSAPAPSQVSNVTPTLTEWRRRCVRRREDTELASSNTTRVSNGSWRRNIKCKFIFSHLFNLFNFAHCPTSSKWDMLQGARWRDGAAPPTTSCSSRSARTTWCWGRGRASPPGGRGSATVAPSSVTRPTHSMSVLSSYQYPTC